MLILFSRRRHSIISDTAFEIRYTICALFQTSCTPLIPTIYRQQSINSVWSPCTNRTTKFPNSYRYRQTNRLAVSVRPGRSAPRADAFLYPYILTIFLPYSCIKTRYRSTFVRSNRQTVLHAIHFGNCCSTSRSEQSHTATGLRCMDCRHASKDR
jgi:hypothetical protein